MWPGNGFVQNLETLYHVWIWIPHSRRKNETRSETIESVISKCGVFCKLHYDLIRSKYRSLFASVTPLVEFGNYLRAHPSIRTSGGRTFVTRDQKF